MRACRLEPVEHTPVWFMRQAGRSLPEYRELRKRYGLFDIVGQPELCAEVTLQPVRAHGVDAAVMFADIMLPLAGMGVEFELVDGVGPIIARPLRSPAGVDALRVPARRTGSSCASQRTASGPAGTGWAGTGVITRLV